MTDYHPIPCAQHERLEFAVLRKIRLQLTYLDGPDTVRATVLPLDVYTREGAEWLRFNRVGTDQETVIRLDAIVSVEELGR